METDDKHLSIGWSSAVMVFWLAAACATTLKSQSPGSSSPSGRPAVAAIMETPIKDYNVENVSIAEALVKLRAQDYRHVLIGFEQVPHREGEKRAPISLKIDAGTLGNVVQRLCQADPRYEYQVVESPVGQPKLKGFMIEVRPRGAVNNPADILNMRVGDYEVDSNITAAGAISRISQDAPELREYLERKAEEWAQRKGTHSGEIGAIMSGNMVPPRFTLRLRDVTVRQILDAISLKSIEIYREEPDVDSRGMRGKPYPTGWRYNFVINPDASTGIGGIPEWTAL